MENLDFGIYGSPSDILYGTFADTLRQRKAQRTPLKTLYVDRCIIGAKRADGLEKHVQELHWDGKEESPREK